MKTDKKPTGEPVVEVILPRHLQRRAQLKKLVKVNPKVLLIGGGVIVVGLLSYTVLGFMQQTSKNTCAGQNCPSPTPTPQETASTAPQATPTPKVAALLDGSMVEAGKEKLHPLSVMVENHPQARPQSGLGQANLVYEALVEGGITRFMAVYADPTTPIKVGPVRSARSHFVTINGEFDGFYAHVGGSNDALNLINSNGTLDLNQFSVGEPVFKREFNRSVSLEHTMYSSTEKLWNYATGNKGWSKAANFSPWLFKDESTTDKSALAQTVSVNISESTYAVSWSYNPSTNSYLRSMGGGVHKDANTGSQISVKNVILQTVNRTSTTSDKGEQAWKFDLSSGGSAVIINEGVATKGSWKKSNGRTRFYDGAGQEVSLVRGSTWIHLVHANTPVSY